MRNLATVRGRAAVTAIVVTALVLTASAVIVTANRPMFGGLPFRWNTATKTITEMRAAAAARQQPVANRNAAQMRARECR